MPQLFPVTYRLSINKVVSGNRSRSELIGPRAAYRVTTGRMTLPAWGKLPGCGVSTRDLCV